METSRKEFINTQIKKYQAEYRNYETFRKIIKRILKILLREVTRDFVILGKVKSVSELAETLSTAGDRAIPIENYTDLCQIFVVLTNTNDVLALNELLHSCFKIIPDSTEIDWKIATKSPGTHPSIRIVVQLPQELDLKNILRIKNPEQMKIAIPPDLPPLKGEIYLRTNLQHVGELLSFDKITGKGIQIPPSETQEQEQILKLLELADKLINNFAGKLQEYESNYTFFPSDKIADEIVKLKEILAFDPTNVGVAQRIARLALIIGDWASVQTVLEQVLHTPEWEKTPKMQTASILRDLGIAICKLNGNNPFGNEFKVGQGNIQTAIQINPRDSDAYAALGGTYRKQGKDQDAQESYKKAVEVNPGDPYPLGNYLIYEIRNKGNLSPVESNRLKIEQAIEKRIGQAEVSADIPWAYFDLGLFNLLLGDVNRSLLNYLMAMKSSADAWMIKTALDSFNQLEIVHDQIKGAYLVKRLLLLGIVFHPKVGLTEKNDQSNLLTSLKKCMEFKHTFEKNPIFLIVGNSSNLSDTYQKKYQDIFTKQFHTFITKFETKFKDFRINIVSDGSKTGIGGIVGNIQVAHPGNVKTIAYLPQLVPSTIPLDNRYSEVIKTQGTNFSILEILQFWYDVFSSGLKPQDIKVIGIGGGSITGLALRIALVFGAQVALFENSGGASNELMKNTQWSMQNLEGNKTNQSRRAFKILMPSSDDLCNFLTRPFVSDSDIDNLRKVMIITRAGIDLYVKNFANEPIESSLLSGILTAIDNVAMEISAGQVLSIKCQNAHLTGGFSSDMNFKVMFLLFNYPTSSLEQKIVQFIKRIEKKITAQKINQPGLVIPAEDPDLYAIFKDVFGPEILKFFSPEMLKILGDLDF